MERIGQQTAPASLPLMTEQPKHAYKGSAETPDSEYESLPTLTATPGAAGVENNNGYCIAHAAKDNQDVSHLVGGKKYLNVVHGSEKIKFDCHHRKGNYLQRVFMSSNPSPMYATIL